MFLLKIMLIYDKPLLSSQRNKTMSAFNPLSPKSDQHRISPCNINALYHRVVMWIMDMITQDKFDWYFINFSPLLL